MYETELDVRFESICSTVFYNFEDFFVVILKIKYCHRGCEIPQQGNAANTAPIWPEVITASY